MKSKDRLYVALYARGGTPTMPDKEDTYHWALIVRPKFENKDKMGVRYDAKERPSLEEGGGGRGQGSEWFFQEIGCRLTAADMILVRVTIGKVIDGNRLVDVLRNTPIRQGQGWNCVSWVKEALEKLKSDGKVLGTSIVEWENVCNETMGYCQCKKDQHRFDGKRKFDMSRVPTYDLIERSETIV